MIMHYLAKTKGKVVKGYGRGAKELGFPTANLDKESVEELAHFMKNGVYCGYCKLGKNVFPMVMSLGENDFYNNDKKSAEVHILKHFDEDFYGETLDVIVCEYIRNQMDFSDVSQLIDAIKNDIVIARQILAKHPIPSFCDFAI